MDALHLSKCTSMAVSDDCTADGHVLVAHNEDWLPEDEQDVYLVHASPDDEPSFLAMTYGGLLPNIGFNEAGIAQCCDSVYPNDSPHWHSKIDRVPSSIGCTHPFGCGAPGVGAPTRQQDTIIC